MTTAYYSKCDSFIPKKILCRKIEMLKKTNEKCIKMFSKKFSFKNKINLIKGLNTFYYIFSPYLTLNYHLN